MTSSPFFDNICTLPLSTDLFAQALHPTRPHVAVALATGHVETYRLPSVEEDESEVQPSQQEAKTTNGTNSILSTRRRSSTASLNGLGSIDTVWRTRRHKGSCRSLCYSHDGAVCYSAGTDGLVKAFDSETGKVISKVALPLDGDGKADAPSLLHALSPQILLVATDSGALHVYNLNGEGCRIAATPSTTHHPHNNEHVAGLVEIPPSESSTSGFAKQWITVGGSTLAVMDLYKGLLATSEDQEEELTSVMYISGLKKGGTSVGEKVLVGQADGVVSLWERGVWGDLDERIVVDRNNSAIECLCPVPADFAPKSKLKMNEKIVAAGLEDGTIRFLRIGRNMVIHEWDLKHEELDGVIGLGFDSAGRMVSGGGQTVKVWTPAKSTSIETTPNGSGKRDRDDSDEEDWEDKDDSSVGDVEVDDDGHEEADGSEEEADRDRGKRKKRKRNKGKDKSGGRVLTFSGML